MYSARARCRYAYAYLTGKLRMRAGHKSRQFLMRHLDKFHGFFRAVQGAHHAINAVARIAKNAFDAPGAQTLYYKITYLLAHRLNFTIPLILVIFFTE